MNDITNPKHYQIYEGLEALDVMRAVMTDDEYKGYLKGNILKYKLRACQKGTHDDVLKDLAKAKQYQAILNELEYQINSEVLVDYFKIIVCLQGQLTTREIAKLTFCTEEQIKTWKSGLIEPDSHSGQVIQALWMNVTNKTIADIPKYQKFPVKNKEARA